MPILVHNCPRCGAREMTFDVSADKYRQQRYDWQRIYETFAVCRKCHGATIFVLSQKDAYHPTDQRHQRAPTKFPDGVGLNDSFGIEGYICIKDLAAAAPPEHCPEDIAAAFREGATCLTVECFNAAGAMFRLALDLATGPMLPPKDDPSRPDFWTCFNLRKRLAWLFANGKLPAELEGLAECVREDGNDGAHAGTLTEDEATDLQEFATRLFERIYTVPKRLELAKRRRQERRSKAT